MRNGIKYILFANECTTICWLHIVTKTFDHEWVLDTPLSEVKAYYTDEINTLLAEENIGYQFVNGEFQRRGRAQTQKNIQRVGVVLGPEKFKT